MSNFKKYIRVNNDWEELCPEAPHLVLTVTEDYEGNRQTSWSLNGETATMANSAELMAKIADSDLPILVDYAQYSYRGSSSEDNATWVISNVIAYDWRLNEASESYPASIAFEAVGFAVGSGTMTDKYGILGNVALLLGIEAGYSAEGTDVPPTAHVPYYDAQKLDWHSRGGSEGGIFVDESTSGVEGYYDFYAKKYVSARTSSTPTYSTSSGNSVTTISNVSAPGLSTVQNSALTGSQLYWEPIGFEFTHSLLTFDYGWGNYVGEPAWILPIQGDYRQVLAHGSTYRKSVLVMGGHQGYVSMLTSGWDSNSDTGTMTFTTCSLPETDTTFIGKVAQTTESGGIVHRITLGYGQDALDILPFYTQPSYWKNYQPNVHFRIRLQSTSGLTSAPDVTVLRIPYYNGDTSTYTDYPIHVNGDLGNTVDIRELSSFYLDVTFSDNSAQGFYITNLLPNGDLVNY